MDEPGSASGVAMVVEATLEDGQVRRFYVAGAALELGPSLVATAYHAMFRDIGPLKGPLKVLAMPARLFNGLDQDAKLSTSRLRDEGAVEARGYHSWAADLGCPPRIVPSGLDLTILELAGPLPGLPARLPHVMSEGEGWNLHGHLVALGPDARVEIIVEGMGRETSYSAPGGRCNGILSVGQTP